MIFSTICDYCRILEEIENEINHGHHEGNFTDSLFRTISSTPSPEHQSHKPGGELQAHGRALDTPPLFSHNSEEKETT
jgi:hypothetical protein